VEPAASTARELGALGGAELTSAGVEPWGDEGGGLAAPAPRPSWLRRTRESFKNSVWAPVALKLVAFALGMGLLSVVGIVSILSGTGGVRVPLASALQSDIRAAWLRSEVAHPAPALASQGASAGSSSASEGAPPTILSSGPPAAASAPTPEASAAGGTTTDGKVILNLATTEDLRHLPGVGQKRAEAILALRARLGRFKQVSDLLRVKGIGVRGLRKIMPHVLLDAPKPAA